MNELDARAFGFDTLSVRAGESRTGEQEHNAPIFLTSSFVFANAREAAARFSGEEPGNVYSRFTNPTVRAFERRLAVLEGRYRVHRHRIGHVRDPHDRDDAAALR